MGYFTDTLRGVSWIGSLRGVTRVIALIKNIIIARILSPTQFGFYGIAMLILALLEILTETGVNVFLIQEDGELSEYIDSAWVISILRGLIISLIIFLFTPLIVSFFKVPGAHNIVALVAVTPLVRGFINPAIVRLQKDMLFKKDFYFRGVQFLIDAVAAISLTIYLGSAIGLIWGNIIGVLFELVLSFLLFKPKPRLRFDRKLSQKIISRGKWITGTGIFQYAFKNGDDIVVGKILDAGSLGLYQMAFKIATLPVSEVADVFGKVTLPIYVKLNKDIKRLKRAYVLTSISIFVLTLPFALVLIIFAPQILGILLGERWIGASGALRVVAVYSIVRVILNPALTVMMAMKKQEYATVVTFAGIIGIGLSIFPLVRMYGIVGAGISTIIGSLASVPFAVYYINKIFKQA